MLDYSTNNDIFVQIHLWLVDPYGNILLKKPAKKLGETLDIEEITTIASNLYNAIKLAEYKYGILEVSKKVKEVYEFSSTCETTNYLVRGFIAKIDMDVLQIEKSEDNVFINYRDLDTCIREYIINEIFKESYLNLITHIDNEFGLSVKALGYS